MTEYCNILDRLMSRPMKKYTIKQLRADFPDDKACLDWLISYHHPKGIVCRACEKVTKHYKVSGRRSYCCSQCGHHFYPTAGTIFHKSRTSLTDWFHVIYIMSSNKAGTSARQIQREIGVTYKTAWRMMHQIRSMMNAPDEQLEGDVEVDETFVHPNTFKRSSAQRRYGRDARRTGEVIFGAVQRGGSVKVWHVPTAGVRILRPIIQNNVKVGSTIHSDGWGAYRTLSYHGYDHRTTNHSAGEYYTPSSYTQNIENVWSHLKRGMKGVFRHVSPTYLQLYANEFAWRYNHRHNDVLFWCLLTDVTLTSTSYLERQVFSEQPF